MFLIIFLRVNGTGQEVTRMRLIQDTNLFDST